MIIKLTQFVHGLMVLLSFLFCIMLAIAIFFFQGFFIGIIGFVAICLAYSWVMDAIDSSYNDCENYLESRV